MTEADRIAVITHRDVPGARFELGDPRSGRWLESSVVYDARRWR